MQKLSDVRFSDEGDISSLKELWHISFGDDYEYIDKFFTKAFEKDNVLVIRDGDTVVSALYLIESHVLKDGRRYKAYYVYAVGTLPSYRGKGLMTALLEKADNVANERDVSYLFLVPAKDSLYRMYEKLGYKKGFFCKEDVITKNSFSCSYDDKDMDYASYLDIRYEFLLDESVVFGEKGFDVFISPKGENIKYLYFENIGCCVYEKIDGEATVWELFGDEEVLLNGVFELCGVGSIRLRRSVSEGGSPCGMYKSFGDAPKLKSAFIGAYGG